MNRYLLTVAFILSALFTNGQTISHDNVQQILSDILTAQKALQGFMNIAAEKSKQFSYDDCRTDYVGLESLDIAAKGATVRANRKRHYWGSLTAYYPAENPQYRIFVIMEQNIYNGTYYGVPLCAPVVARIIKSLNN